MAFNISDDIDELTDVYSHLHRCDFVLMKFSSRISISLNNLIY